MLGRQREGPLLALGCVGGFGALAGLAVLIALNRDLPSGLAMMALGTLILLSYRELGEVLHALNWPSWQALARYGSALIGAGIVIAGAARVARALV